FRIANPVLDDAMEKVRISCELQVGFMGWVDWKSLRGTLGFLHGVSFSSGGQGNGCIGGALTQPHGQHALGEGRLRRRYPDRDPSAGCLEADYLEADYLEADYLEADYLEAERAGRTERRAVASATR